jgi:hypothetical protein
MTKRSGSIRYRGTKLAIAGSALAATAAFTGYLSHREGAGGTSTTGSDTTVLVAAVASPTPAATAAAAAPAATAGATQPAAEAATEAPQAATEVPQPATEAPVKPTAMPTPAPLPESRVSEGS